MIISTIHKGLPFAYESYLLDRYNSYLTTCPYINIYHSDYDVYHLFVYDNDEVKDLIVFGTNKSTAYCFNSLVAMDAQIVTKIIPIIFEEFKNIQRIKIDASYIPYQLSNSILTDISDNQILELPTSIDDYLTNLGAKKRKNLKLRTKKLASDFETVNFSVKFGDEIDDTLIDKIIEFNRNRMKSKGKKSGIDNGYENSIYRYCKHYGCVGIMEVNGVIVAGSIGTLINKDIYMHVIAFDDNFLSYNLGEVCAFNMIQYSIENTWERFHFLWGRNELKRRMMAENHDLYSYSVFRNHTFKYFVIKWKVEIQKRFKNCNQPYFLNSMIKVIKKIRCKLSLPRQ